MALSNIFKEPRREITETVIGATVFGVYLYGDYAAALWLQGITGGYSDAIPWPLGMAFGFCCTVVLFLILIVIHFLGEKICGSLSKFGADPRPRRRY